MERLRLLQLADSAFPVGGFAYSHGLEWLVNRGDVRGEPDTRDFLAVFVEQVVARQHLPAAALAMRVRGEAGIVRADIALDASISAEAEREGGRAMGARLLELASSVLGSPTCASLLTAVRNGETPGQYTVAFAAAARDAGVDVRPALEAIGYGLVSSVTQAAVRLGVIGAEAATRLTAFTLPAIAAAAERTVREPRPRVGAFAPGIESAAMLQPTLRFRMFAS